MGPSAGVVWMEADNFLGESCQVRRMLIIRLGPEVQKCPSMVVGGMLADDLFAESQEFSVASILGTESIQLGPSLGVVRHAANCLLCPLDAPVDQVIVHRGKWKAFLMPTNGQLSIEAT